MIRRHLWNVLLAPDDGSSGGGSGQAAETTTVASPAASGLTADQQKVAAAVNKVAATEPPAKTGKPIRPVISTPPAKVLDGVDFKAEGVEGIDDDVEVESGKKTDDKKVEPAAKKDDKATVQAAAQPQVKVEDKKAAVGTAQQVKVGDAAKTRDYTGFTPQEAELLKQMPNAAFDYAAKHLRDYKALQQQKGTPENYYQHPDAYVLTPEYREAEQTINYLSFEQQHWKNQLINIRTGKPWKGLSGFDDKGQPIYTEAMKATDEAEVDVANALSMLTSKVQETQTQKAAMQQGFKQRVEKDIADLNAQQAQRFEWVADPKKAEEKIPVQGIGDVPIKQIKDDFKALFATYHHGSPILDLASNMFVALQIYANRIRELEAATQHEKGLKEEVIRAEPTIDNNGAVGGSDKKDLVFDEADMP